MRHPSTCILGFEHCRSTAHNKEGELNGKRNDFRHIHCGYRLGRNCSLCRKLFSKHIRSQSLAECQSAKIVYLKAAQTLVASAHRQEKALIYVGFSL